MFDDSEGKKSNNKRTVGRSLERKEAADSRRTPQHGARLDTIFTKMFTINVYSNDEEEVGVVGEGLLEEEEREQVISKTSDANER